MSSSKSDKQAVTLPVLIGAIVVLAACIIAWGYFNFAPPPAVDTQKRTVATAEQQQIDLQTAWLKEKARQTGGDWQKLSPEDQVRLKMIAKDESTTILKSYANAK